MAPSSSGLGRQILILQTGIRLPVGSPGFFVGLILLFLSLLLYLLSHQPELFLFHYSPLLTKR